MPFLERKLKVALKHLVLLTCDRQELQLRFAHVLQAWQSSLFGFPPSSPGHGPTESLWPPRALLRPPLRALQKPWLGIIYRLELATEHLKTSAK